MKYAPTSHRGLTSTPPCAAAPAGMSRTNARPTNISASANFAGDDGWRGPSLTHSHAKDRKSTRLNSSHGYISYAVFCLKKKKKKTTDLIERNTTRIRTQR